MHPTFALFGQSLAAARSGPLIASLVGLLATYWIARQLWDRTTAALVGLLLALSPTFLKFSRLALPEMVALAPVLASVGAAVRYQRGGSLTWLIGASLLFGLSMLIKPVAAPAILPIALLLAARGGPRRHDLALAGLACAAILVLGILAVGPAAIWEQVEFRWQSRLVEGRGPDWNWWKIVDELSHDRLGIFALAAAGALRLLRLDSATLAVIGGWCAANLLLLLIHTPLHDKHILIMLPPVALLAGYGLTRMVRSATRFGRWPRRSLPPRLQATGSGLGVGAGLAPPVPRAGHAPPLPRLLSSVSRERALRVAPALALLTYVVSLPGLVQRDGVLVSASEMIEPDPAQHWYADAAIALERTTRPGSFVVTDFPYLAFRANRLVPPELVESSLTRIRAGSLTDELAIAETERFEPDAVLLWWDRLVRLSGFKRWLDQRYQVARVYAADAEAVTTLYLPLGADPAAVGQALEDPAAIPSGASFGTGLVLDRWGLDDRAAAPGGQRSLTVRWWAAQTQRRDLVAVLTLRTRDRIVWTSPRLPLLGSGDGQREWAAGRSIVWSGLIEVPRRLAPGAYLLSIRVAAERDPEFLPVQEVDRLARRGPEDPKGVELAVIEVNGPPAVKE